MGFYEIVSSKLKHRKNFEDGSSFCQVNIRLDQTVAELKRRLTTVVQLSTNNMRLYYINKCSAFGPEEMKYNTRALHSYSIQDGDELLVVPKTK